jgi:prenyltransferase beta subunit
LNKIEIERMPSFKPKTAKKIKYNKRSSVTLDTKHKEFLNEFNKDEKDRIPHLKLERQHLKNTLKDQSLNIEQRLDVQDKIIETTEKIKEIQSKKKDYFLDNSKYIFEYFENKKNIS